MKNGKTLFLLNKIVADKGVLPGTLRSLRMKDGWHRGGQKPYLKAAGGNN
jgi:hypothetical protein